MPTSDDVRRLAEQLMAELTPQQQQTFLGAIGADRSMTLLENVLRVPKPVVGDAPTRIRGFRVRLDLVGAKPPVWRRLELHGDLALDRLHRVIQAAMGWLDGHLHRFRTGSDPRSPYFVTPFDVEEGEDGVLEDGVRLDQVLTGTGDRLWYQYDFGDDWDHVLAVEAVLDEPPAEVRCTGGRMACPPEDCGGIWGYAELAAWVRGGCAPSSVPAPFEDAGHARDWLPLYWHPDRFDVEEANTALAAAVAAPVPVAGELAALREQLEQAGNRALTQVLARTAPPAAVEVSEADAARLIEPYVVLLDVIGDGVRLTSAGYLPPALVERLAERTCVTGWWIGKANREDLTWPVAQLRDSARALGLVSVRKGRLAPTALARRCRDQPSALWRHIISRLPVGRTDFDRQAGWLALAVVGSGSPAEEWTSEIRNLLLGLGWRVEGSPVLPVAAVVSPTLDVLELLSGKTRGRLTGLDPTVAATARAVIGAGPSDAT
ncbi:plasmid pRiA4b ORF-3 family protein [Rhodococcus opacus]|uniref:plasmid pRiA4b ORF-3 family protein n=1 Tax=Rhodococcus opacus TaxID=37919 RepID=UPI0024BA1811|nr:plasmid pRiA4b ORF-3 family protein [Rhodococcus opacus]MDJ0419990.1 plasmid pRiA4b ORF-3 family protein [Rhodococcus opacus]